MFSRVLSLFTQTVTWLKKVELISFSILFLFDNIELVNWFKLRNVQI